MDAVAHPVLHPVNQEIAREHHLPAIPLERLEKHRRPVRLGEHKIEHHELRARSHQAFLDQSTNFTRQGKPLA
ncbi:MAG: hypothetical protein M3372_02290, partial [Verrucomicrobiota bacterium]|nr:hypothetical protein [Verrucomicrobiota bacterium]